MILVPSSANTISDFSNDCVRPRGVAEFLLYHSRDPEHKTGSKMAEQPQLDVFQQIESNDGIRFSWNVLPATRPSATALAIPVSCMYTPFKELPTMPVLTYPPVLCSTNGCKAVLNPYCTVNFANKLWMCPFCLTRNHFPSSYSAMTNENRVAEIMQQNTTIEYVLDQTPRNPIFLFLIDLCIAEEEVDALRSCVMQNLMLIPENSLVGLITFGRNVNIYEMTFDECPKSYLFNGTREYKSTDIARLLGIKSPSGPESKSSAFISPLSVCETNLNAIFEDMKKDGWHSKNSERPQSCAGSAFSVAIGLLEAARGDSHGRILSFLGTAPTVGVSTESKQPIGGQIAAIDFKETIRSHHDIVKNRAPYYLAACDFYKKLAVRALAAHLVVDIFACCLQQIGLAEMKVLVEETGGYLILDDSFTKGVFSGSFKKIFSRDEQKGDVANDLSLAFSAQFQATTSREFKIKGAIGNCTSLKRKNPCVSDEQVGVGDTCAWSLGALDRQTSLAIYFGMEYDKADQLRDTKQGYLQFLTTYRHSSGRTHLRVSTISKTFADHSTPQGLNYLKAGFDQEAAAVLVARYAVWRSQKEDIFDIRGWIDRSLINLCKLCGVYTPNNAESFKLTQNFSFFPQFMFHLRRSQFLQVFNSAPDETTFFRHVLSREHVTNTISMIQPSLMCYSLDGPARPVALV